MSDEAAVFEALAHEARRHLVALLGHLGGELSSGYLARHFQHSWPTTTRHLKVLEQAGIVLVRREGRSSFYRLDRDRLRTVVSGWLRNVEPVDPQKTWPNTGAKTTQALADDSTDLARKRRPKGTTDEDLSRDHGSLRSRRR
ncbi:MAG: helix-turn-helix transcriptional regulator [Deltaproteobacteria bacterium]|nr:helix-turn-helix transcriptional regulator [Deltaproteobacteria bacterium]